MRDTRHPAVAGYDLIAEPFDAARRRKPWEIPYFEALADLCEPGDPVLDCGCGTGHDGLTVLLARGADMTALDGSSEMLARFRLRNPKVRTVLSDMLAFETVEHFGAVIAWDSFFHLSHEEQRLMLQKFGQWVRPGGFLLMTTGPDRSSVSGQMFGVGFSYASMSHEEYADELATNGFLVRRAEFDEPNSAIHKIWLAERSSAA